MLKYERVEIMGLFEAIGFFILLWIYCKWCDRETPYQKELRKLEEDREAGIITFNEYLDKSYECTCRNTQIGYKKK